jgi:tRNA pseudouridine38-40 synthase
MPRYKILIEYDGACFAGWQRQAHAISVQDCIENAILAFSKESISVNGAGRTDAGVHALGQVAHFDLQKEFKPKEVQGAINHFVRPHKLIITDCEIVDSNFHARFSALKRYYRYQIFNRSSNSIFSDNYSWHIREKLDLDAMQLAANLLEGQHDFTSFRTVHCQAMSPIKTIDKITISQEQDFIYIDLKAKSFLHHMVRNIVGSLINVGLRKWPVDEIATILAAKNRNLAGQTAPAKGLFFVKVDY